MTDTTPFRPVIRTQLDLEATWRRLMEPLGFAGHSVWMMLVGPDDRPVPQITEIEDCDEPPDVHHLTGLADFLRHLHGDLPRGARFAFLVSRPGSGGVTDSDRTWASGLYWAAREAGVPIEVVHRANDVDLVPVPMDEAMPNSA